MQDNVYRRMIFVHSTEIEVKRNSAHAYTKIM